MKKNKYKSLKNFTERYELSNIDKNTLIISDIDGVFFRGIFDPREILGIINKENKRAFEQILSQKCACWLFTNRPTIFKHLPFIRQISTSIKNVAGITPPIYSNCSHFLKERSQNYAIIMNAKKPGEESQKVVEQGIANFEKVIYLSAQDLPFYYTDQQLVEKLKKTPELEKLTFIEIDH